MAALRAPSASFLAAFLPVARASILSIEQPLLLSRAAPVLARLRLHVSSFLPAALLPLPTALGDLWDGILAAVPKKKTSHMKKRHRQMAGKALKDLTALNKCSACGRLKRAHVLCPYCVQSIKQWFSNGFKTKDEVDAMRAANFSHYNTERRNRGFPERTWETQHRKDGPGKGEAQ